MRIFCVLVLIFTTSASGLAQQTEFATDLDYRIAQAESSARTNQLSSERVLFAADQAIDAAAVIVSSVDNLRIVHAELKRLTKGVPGARAIIVLDKKGQLKHDSYKYPATPLDLSQRLYFKEAKSKKSVVIGEQVIGRTSGSSFVPIAKKVGDLTFVVVASPYALVDVQSECADCWSIALQSEGKLVTMFPPEEQVSQTLLRVPLSSSQDIGSNIIRYKKSVVVVAWRKSPDFPLINVTVRGLPEDTPVDIDMN